MTLPSDTSIWTQAQYQSATASQIAALNAAQVKTLIHPNWLTAAAFAAIPASAISNLTAAAFAGLDSAHLAALTATQVAALTAAQFKSLSAAQVAALSGATLSKLSSTQLLSLSTTQLAGISGAGASGLTAAQVTLLGQNVASLSAAAISGLTVATVSQLGAAQLAALSKTQISALSPTQIAVLSAAQVTALTENQLQTFGKYIQFLNKTALVGLSQTDVLAVYTQLSAAQKAALPPAQAVSIALATNNTASLVASMSTNGALKQVQQVIASGQSLFSYQGVLAVLDGIESAIPASGLTSAQFSDLHLLATAVSAVDGNSSYLATILNAFVNGNADNATWTGGASKSTALGNLGIGSSVTKVDELSDKWFLGSDTPTWTTSTTYTAKVGSLFGAAGVSSTDPVQGSIDDCYLVAAAIETALVSPSTIQSMFTDNGNGTYGVRMYAPNGSVTYITVNNALPANGVSGTVSGAQWVSLLEKAYVQYNAEFAGATNAYSAIDGGWAGGLSAITGDICINYMCNASGSKTSWDTTIKSTIINDLTAGDAVLFGSFLSDKDTHNSKVDLVSSHEFAVIGYDQATQEFILQNPWGAAGSASYNGTFEQSIDQLWGGLTGTTSSSGFIVGLPAKGSSTTSTTTASLPAKKSVGMIASAANQLAQAIVNPNIFSSSSASGTDSLNLANGLSPQFVPSITSHLAHAHAGFGR
ncbi:C2 family cysteine protease [Novosphingobium sp.]|uniref:C2 family cysteine protease n=1 Tax=Novosphingobium sp. TaxID=1874826 RepID=UPI003D0F43AD